MLCFVLGCYVARRDGVQSYARLSLFLLLTLEELLLFAVAAAVAFCCCCCCRLLLLIAVAAPWGGGQRATVHLPGLCIHQMVAEPYQQIVALVTIPDANLL